MTTDEIQSIISYSYPLIQKYYGKGKLPIPKIDTSHRNTYAMHSGEPEAQGEHDATSIAEYYKGVIYLYLPNITNEEELLAKYKKIYSYDEDPNEIEAHKNEENWKMFSKL